MAALADLKILYQLTLAPVRGETHAARLESFYACQAENYDDFRRRLLPGRERLYAKLAEPLATSACGVWIDLGGGTGANLEHLGGAIANVSKLYVVDLSPSLLKVAKQRASKNGWSNVQTVEADATTFSPPEPTDVVTLSYSLTMIPDWFAVLEHAATLLKPGGKIGVVDFFVGRKHPAAGQPKHSWFTRTFWPAWFAADNVFLSPDHVPCLQRLFEVEDFAASTTRIPYLPLARVPYYAFIGRKRRDATSAVPAGTTEFSPRL